MEFTPIELKLCPFCGGEAVFASTTQCHPGTDVSYDEWCIYCTCCDAAITHTKLKKAVKFWNRRANVK